MLNAGLLALYVVKTGPAVTGTQMKVRINWYQQISKISDIAALVTVDDIIRDQRISTSILHLNSIGKDNKNIKRVDEENAE